MPISFRDMPEELRTALDNARIFNKTAWDSSLEKGTPCNSARENTFAVFLVILFEHQDATLRLLETGENNASAFALARIILETFERGFWMYLCASEEQVNKIRSGCEPYPAFIKMTEDVDNKLKANGKFYVDQKLWRILNGFTHTGGEQLARRFNDNGDFIPNYPLEEVLTVLSMATRSLSIMSQFFCLITKDSVARNKIKDEWHRLFGQEEIQLN